MLVCIGVCWCVLMCDTVHWCWLMCIGVLICDIVCWCLLVYISVSVCAGVCMLVWDNGWQCVLVSCVFVYWCGSMCTDVVWAIMCIGVC